MSRREEQRKKSLDLLGKFAWQAGSAPTPPTPPPAAPRPVAKPKPEPPAAPPKKPRPARAADPRFEGRQAKLEEAKALRQRRQNELVRNTNLEWRGMDNMGVPASIRRTGFDRVEPTVTTKIQDILGDAKEKEGRAKNRAKGQRVGGSKKK